MTPLRIFAVFLILCLATVAWFVLGTSVVYRTENVGPELGVKVGELWGSSQSQSAPRFTFTALDGTRTIDRAVGIVSSDIVADFTSEPRQKGLLWYATYAVDFSAGYGVANPTTKPVTARMTFSFPDPQGAYDGFAVKVDGREVPYELTEGNAVATFPVPAGARVRVDTGYRTNGMDTWSYLASPDGAGSVKDFTLTAKVDTDRIDFGDGSVSPTAKERDGAGWALTWRYESIVSGRPIALVMPKPANPGPLSYRITYFAPVSLLFFFAGLVLLISTKGLRLHPVHFGFLAAAFFAFHLLFAYLVDRVDINVSFAIASVVSVLLVMGYLRAVLGPAPALLEIAVSQVVFLVLFAYSFFFEGLTGLAVTIGSVLTLAYYMAKTAKVDWEAVFARKTRLASAGDPGPQA
jgi:hypothetical protein